MRYATVSIRILGDVLGTSWNSEPDVVGMDRTFPCTGRGWLKPDRRARRPLVHLVIDAYQDVDRCPNSIIDAGAGVVVKRRSKLTGATRERRFPLRMFESVHYLLDLPDEPVDDDEDEMVPF